MDIPLPDYSTILKDYSSLKISSLRGRYLKEEEVLNVLKNLSYKFKIKNEGHSEQGRIISSFHLGSGSKKILIWSQMHGNESTTTKSVLDLMNFFSLNTDFSKALFNSCRFVIIPVLNPDGAVNYTRVNANGVDLNRDALDQTQAESQILQKIYADFQPDVCFNMHDQRTIFSAGNTNRPATVSFLSPSYDSDRSINATRLQSMSLISSANEVLQNYIPGQVGRYDDGFNINCIGDFFQKKGTPTILFEAGHYPDDYEREVTRKYIFIALLHMITDVANHVESIPESHYFKIPENEKLFYDLIIRNVEIAKGEIKDVAVHYKEELKNSKIEFIPRIEKIGDLNAVFGHREIDVKHQILKFDKPQQFKENEVFASFRVDDNVFVI